MLQDFNAKRCSRCELIFKNSAESSKHFLVKHGLKVLVCTKCDHGWFSVKNLKYHQCCPPSPIKSAKENQPSQQKNAVKQEVKTLPKVLSLSCNAIDETDLTSTLSKPHGNKTITDFFSLTVKRNPNKICKCPKLTVKNQISMQEKTDEKEDELEKSITHFDPTSIHTKFPFSKCSTPKSPRARNKMKSKKNVTTPAIPEETQIIQSFCLSDSESEDADVDADKDVEILEWNPGTDVKPVIKLEMEWN